MTTAADADAFVAALRAQAGARVRPDIELRAWALEQTAERVNAPLWERLRELGVISPNRLLRERVRAVAGGLPTRGSPLTRPRSERKGAASSRHGKRHGKKKKFDVAPHPVTPVTPMASSSSASNSAPSPSNSMSND